MSNPASKDKKRQVANRRVAVLLPLPLKGAFDYLVPEGILVAAGDFVQVPLGNRQVVGVVWDSAPDNNGGHDRRVAAEKLKPVAARLDVPPLPEGLRRYLAWVAHYNMAGLGPVLRMAMSVPAVFEGPATRTLYVRGGPWPDRMTPARLQLQEMLIDETPRSVRELMELALVGEGVVRGLIRGGTLLPVEVAADEACEVPDSAVDGFPLSEGQAAAAAELKAAVAAGGYQTFLLEGVTGSGKTEVYFEAIAEALAIPGAQVLVLVPEIALTAQWLTRFRARFGAGPVEWHSDLTQSQRRRAWLAAASGAARVVVGARSALYLPFDNLRLIIVDEEHDSAFKQEEGVIYHARDMAVVRGNLEGFPVLLASATPSLETVINARTGRYTRLHLPDRHGGAAMPDIETIDMRRTPPPTRRHFLSPPLAEALAKTIEAGEQALLFLNRRGYAPLTLCRTCGHRMECPHCSAWLVEHRFDGVGAARLQCHHCGYMVPMPERCPSCDAEESMVPCGSGVERVAEEVAILNPDARILILASDIVSSPSKMAALVAQVTNHEIDIVIGTQMVTKGYHFPKLTLVGVVDADLGLEGGDLRAGERTYQQLAQVAGRAGREALRGRVMLQTYSPEHPVMKALVSGEWESFIDREATMREVHGMPPFGRLVALIVSGPEQASVMTAARALGRTAPRGKDVSVLGPAPAPMALLRGRHRYRLLLKAGKQIAVQAMVRDWLRRARVGKDVRVQVDIDPISFM